MMDNAKLKEYLVSKSTLILATDLAEKINLYRDIVVNKDSTHPVPDMDLMCAIADEIAQRLDTEQQ